MKANISLEGLFDFLQSLSLSSSNKEWLAQKLLEDAHKPAAEEYTNQAAHDFVEQWQGAFADLAQPDGNELDDAKYQYLKEKYSL